MTSYSKKFPIVVGAGVLLLILVYYLALGSGLFATSSTQSTSITSSTTLSNLKLPKLTASIPLPNIHGRIDHMAVDLKDGLLFVTALGNNTVDVIDLNARKVVHTIGGLKTPQSVAYIPENDRLYVTNGGDGTVDIFDAKSFSLVKALSFLNDADNVRYDVTSKLLYVGYGGGGIGIINVINESIIGTISLPAHPESFELQQVGGLIFVNVPTVNAIEVVDRSKKAVIATWQVSQSGNFPMALDEADGRLFVGTRTPPKLAVFDTSSGKNVANIDIAADPDDISYVSGTGLIYISCGLGTLDVVQRVSPDQYSFVGSVPTKAGARTSLFIPSLGTIYVGVPVSGDQGAEVWAYSLDSASKSPAFSPQAVIETHGEAMLAGLWSGRSRSSETF